ncbi:protein Brevis radix-like 1 [Phragmites australis]|uniref:protein Brevis radix-like 1 n=1 Tax=Phragmites australis TaxID=29695 RepID=UPI002D7A2B2D|nr:protein Brevis radix-like 1 [Phragmites australis]
MLTCIACSKQKLAGGVRPPLHEPPEDEDVVDGGVGAATPSTRHAIKALTAQIKDMALKASGAYRHCKPCAGSSAAASRRHHPYHHRGGSGFGGSDAGSGSERFHYAYRRAGSSEASTPRLRSGGCAALSSGDATLSMSARTDFPAGDEEEDDEMASEGGGSGGKEGDAKEWVAQVEPGVLITFVSLAQGGNDLKRIRFSREMFNKWQAQRWWAENYDRVMELYNVQKFNQTVPLPATPKSEDESSKEDSPVTPPLDKERLPRTFHRPMSGGGAMGYSSSDSLEHHSNRYNNGHHHHHHGHQCCDSVGLASTPKLSSISGAKTETSSMDASMRTSSSPEEVDRSGELSVSISNASDQEREWAEEDEPGVYITIRALPGGIRELRRVRFSREMFSEMHARLWWEENRARIHEQYL